MTAALGMIEPAGGEIALEIANLEIPTAMVVTTRLVQAALVGLGQDARQEVVGDRNTSRRAV